MSKIPERTPLAKPAPTEESEHPFRFDHTKPAILSAFGRKGAGKSTFSRLVYDSWPHDKLCIDVNGDADPGPDAERLTLPLPPGYPDRASGLPGSPGRGPRNLHYRAHPGSPTYSDDLDRAVGLALFPQPRRVLVWCGEVAEFMPSAQRTGPNMRTLLHQNRHYMATALFDGPRPMNVDPLVLAQSDYVAIYHLPNPADRQRIAETIGYPPARFHDECETTFRRGKYWFLFWDAEHHQLYRCPPLPVD